MASKRNRNTDGTVVLKVVTNLDDYDGAKKLRDDLDELCSSGESQIVLDLTHVERLNGYGIGKILLFCKRLREMGGDLYFGPMKDGVRGTLEGLMLTGLIKEHS